ncbi:MAG TPA: oligosaccharide flippase family protein [Steroidobacteraceae bacterium]|nr:oligosaccharide flippase family protein [Steroidobacteraceae bacterium]
MQAQQHLHRGFNWLGGAMIIAKITDFGTILLVLRFLTKEQVGTASLVVAFGAVIEAFDGLGTSTALVQAPSLSRIQLDSLFWIIFGAACVVAGLTLLAAPWIASLYGIAGIGGYFLAVAIKQPLVGAAVIPLAMMNRELQFERIAIINVGATFATALSRIGLAILGAGAWAIVIAYTASGLFTLVGALLARPFRPRLIIRMSSVSSLLRFGIRATLSGLCEQMINNVHHLLVGWFYGPVVLAEFRVAFDVAMEPANAAGTLINRTSLPVFAKVSAAREQLVPLLLWSLRRLLAVVAPLAVGIVLASDSITSLIHDEQHHSYAAASLPLKILAAAAVLRVLSQLAYPVMFGSGRPHLAVRFSVTTLLLLSVGMLVVGLNVPTAYGIVAISMVWLAVPPLLLLWQAHYLRRYWHIRAADLLRAAAGPFAAVVLLICVVQAGRYLLGAGSPVLQLAMVLVLSVLACVALLMRDSALSYPMNEGSR